MLKDDISVFCFGQATAPLEVFVSQVSKLNCQRASAIDSEGRHCAAAAGSACNTHMAAFAIRNVLESSNKASLSVHISPTEHAPNHATKYLSRDFVSTMPAASMTGVSWPLLAASIAILSVFTGRFQSCIGLWMLCKNIIFEYVSTPDALSNYVIIYK